MVDSVKVKFTGRLLVPVPPRRQLVLQNELPKLLWGHNGHLLSNQADLDRSIAIFHETVASVVEFTTWQWVLVDLCWQFRARASDVIRAHQWLPFAGIRSLPSLICGGKEISWRGAGSRRALKMYDKNPRSRDEADGVLRVELRLGGAKLREKIDVDAGLDFDALYQIFRAEVVKLAPVTLPEPRKHTFAELAAGLPLEIRSQFLLDYRQGKTTRTARGFERNVSSACLRRIGWDCNDKLPVNHLPELVNTESNRRRCPRSMRTAMPRTPLNLTRPLTSLTKNNTNRHKDHEDRHNN